MKVRKPNRESSSITPPLRGSRQAKGASPPARRWGESRWGAIKRQYTPQTLQKAQTLREHRADAEGLLGTTCATNNSTATNSAANSR